MSMFFYTLAVISAGYIVRAVQDGEKNRYEAWRQGFDSGYKWAMDEKEQLTDREEVSLIACDDYDR